MQTFSMIQHVTKIGHCLPVIWLHISVYHIIQVAGNIVHQGVKLISERYP